MQVLIGIRGMIDPSHVESLMKFLDIQRKHWRVAVERIALAFVRAFTFSTGCASGVLSNLSSPT